VGATYGLYDGHYRIMNVTALAGALVSVETVK
jgi:hypothetical protein